MLWKSVKDRLIEQVQAENARLAQQNIRLISENDALRKSEAKQQSTAKPEDKEREEKRPVTMLEWCRRQSSRSYQYATSRGKTPLVAGVPVGVVNPEAVKRDGTA